MKKMILYLALLASQISLLLVWSIHSFLVGGSINFRKDPAGKQKISSGSSPFLSHLNILPGKIEMKLIALLLAIGSAAAFVPAVPSCLQRR